jgi:hypothetical protein
MTAATFILLSLTVGGLPCRADEPPGVHPGLYYRRACDGGKCASCPRPLYGGPCGPPFDYRLVFNYPWTQTPGYPLPPHLYPIPAGTVPEPVPPPPLDEQARRTQGVNSAIGVLTGQKAEPKAVNVEHAALHHAEQTARAISSRRDESSNPLRLKTQR